MHANACTMRSADTCVFRDPYMGKRPRIVEDKQII